MKKWAFFILLLLGSSLSSANEFMMAIEGPTFDRVEIQERMLKSEAVKNCVLNDRTVVIKFSTDLFTRWKAEQVINQLAFLAVSPEHVLKAPAHDKSMTIELFCN